MCIVDQEPRKVWQYFEEICAIPHGSGNTKEISNYCVRFAQEHNLPFKQDEYNNIIIWKKGTEGYEDAPDVMIQGHLDMVCEKEEDCDIDFTKDGLRLKSDGAYLQAEGTTLGGDDGIAVAYALAILDSEDLPHPPIEAVFTVDEEIGMLGAESIDLSCAKARMLLNIDSEEEGIILAGCAGGLTASCRLPVKCEPAEGEAIRIRVSGLQGGHSGMEIHKGHANSNILMGRFLHQLMQIMPVRMAAIAGGAKDNVIPRETVAVCWVPAGRGGEIAEIAQAFQAMCRHEYENGDPEITLTVSSAGEIEGRVLTRESTETCIFALFEVPNGVQNMSMDMEGMVETSLNLGILTLDSRNMVMNFCIRSSVESAKYHVADQLQTLCQRLGGWCEISGDYPAWEYKKDSVLQKKMVQAFTTLYGKPPKIESVHAGLECGLLTQKIPGLDAVSFGPDILDIHTTRERLSIPSVLRTWELLREVLKNCRD